MGMRISRNTNNNKGKVAAKFPMAIPKKAIINMSGNVRVPSGPGAPLIESETQRGPFTSTNEKRSRNTTIAIILRNESKVSSLRIDHLKSSTRRPKEIVMRRSPRVMPVKIFGNKSPCFSFPNSTIVTQIIKTETIWRNTTPKHPHLSHPSLEISVGKRPRAKNGMENIKKKTPPNQDSEKSASAPIIITEAYAKKAAVQAARRERILVPKILSSRIVVKRATRLMKIEWRESAASR